MVDCNGLDCIFIFSYFLAGKFYKTGQYTISGIISEKFGRSTKLVVSIIMIVALLLVNLGNYLSGSAAISSILGLPLMTCAIITAIVSTFYFTFGGMKGVAWVTILHSLVKYAGVLITLGVALYLTKGWEPMTQQLPEHFFTWDGSIGWGQSAPGLSATWGRFSRLSLLYRLLHHRKVRKMQRSRRCMQRCFVCRLRLPLSHRRCCTVFVPGY